MSVRLISKPDTADGILLSRMKKKMIEAYESGMK